VPLPMAVPRKNTSSVQNGNTTIKIKLNIRKSLSSVGG
jgi:hypothetical protein